MESKAMESEELDVLDFLAYLFLRNGKWEKAQPLYEVLVSMDGSNVRRKLALAYVLLRAGRARDSLALLDLHLSQTDHAPSADLVLLRARALLEQGQRDEALNFIKHPEQMSGHGW